MVDATHSMADDSAKLPILGVFSTTFRTFGKAPFAFLLFGVLSQVPLAGRLIVDPPHVQGFTRSTALVLALNFLLLPVLQSAMTYMAVRLHEDQPISIGRALSLGVRRYLPMLGTVVVSVLAIYAGIFALIVPGVIVALMFAVAIPVCAVEGAGPIASLKRSRFLTKLTRWRILAIYALFFVPLGLLIGGTTVGLAMKGHVLLGQWVNVAIQLLWTPLAAIFSAAIYLELRRLKENVSVARIFD